MNDLSKNSFDRVNQYLSYGWVRKKAFQEEGATSTISFIGHLSLIYLSTVEGKDEKKAAITKSGKQKIGLPSSRSARIITLAVGNLAPRCPPFGRLSEMLKDSSSS